MPKAQAIRISYELLQRWITEGSITNFEVIKGIPEGATFEGVDVHTKYMVMFFSHPSFPEVDADAAKFHGLVASVPERPLKLKEIQHD
jgi:hypothetical protein